MNYFMVIKSMKESMGSPTEITLWIAFYSNVKEIGNWKGDWPLTYLKNEASSEAIVTYADLHSV